VSAIEQRMLEHAIAVGLRELEQHARHLHDKADEITRHVRRFEAAQTAADKADELRFALGTLTSNTTRRVDVLAHTIGEIGGCLARIELRAELAPAAGGLSIAAPAVVDAARTVVHQYVGRFDATGHGRLVGPIDEAVVQLQRALDADADRAR
jgi:hypothetical protein